MSTDQPLEPCPFCGSENIGPSYLCNDDGINLTSICCVTCEAAGPLVTITDGHAAQEIAENRSADLWNNRSNRKESHDSQQ